MAMDDHDAREDVAALVRIRTQLTVALLAVGRLSRTLGPLPQVERLCTLARDALLRVRDEVAGIEARIWRREGHEGPTAETTDEYPPAP
jgi:hypothetical protein